MKQYARNPQWQSPDEAASLAIANLLGRRWAAEVELLSAIAPIGRWGLELARRATVTVNHFGCEDTAAIWIATVYSADANRNLIEQRAHDVRTALRSVGCYLDDDGRPFIAGSVWGPGAVAVLMARTPKIVAEETLPVRAASLLQIIADERTITKGAA